MRRPVTANGSSVMSAPPMVSRPPVGVSSRAINCGSVLPAIAGADDGDIGADRKVEIDPFEQMDAIGVDDIDMAGHDLAAERLDPFRPLEQQPPIEHLGDMELLDNLLVFDRDILLVLVIVEQFFPR